MKTPKTLRQYAGELCRREGGKSQAKIGDVVQILNMVADDIQDDAKLEIVMTILDDAGARRAKAKKREK